MDEPITFDGRVGIVTGAGGGLGRAYALELARRGASVVVNDLGGSVDGIGQGATRADEVVSEIAEMGGQAVASYQSVVDGAEIVQTALEAFGRLDFVVSNAGILRDRSFANMADDEIDAVLAVHLRGAFAVAQPAFAHMKSVGYGRFVFASSSAGILGNFGQANYGAAKMGLVGLSNVLAIEGAKYNIASNVIAPVARTRMTEDLLGPFADALDPDLVTPMVVYLCSETNPYSHEIFSAGGGRFARFFVGTNRGWIASGSPAVEDVASHMDEIRDISDPVVLGSSSEELQLLARLLSSSEA
ncbi:MAG: SDR family oxidoreductase [Acidimicrobiia bacterium]|nr:SDR family oxidoreductase [Acidimicrobiia bacterium]